MAAKKTTTATDTKKTDTKTTDKKTTDKPPKQSRADQIIALLKKHKDGMTTGEVRAALEVKAAFGLLARMRDAGTIDEFEVEGQRGSSWALADSKGKK